MFLSARLRRLTLCRLIGSQWRRDHRQPDCGRAPPENVAFEVRRGLFGWRKAADSPIGRRASSACRITSGLEGSDGPSEAPHSSRNEHREGHPSGDTPTVPDGLNSSAGWGDAAGSPRPLEGRAGAAGSRLDGRVAEGRTRSTFWATYGVPWDRQRLRQLAFCGRQFEDLTSRSLAGHRRRALVVKRRRGISSDLTLLVPQLPAFRASWEAALRHLVAGPLRLAECGQTGMGSGARHPQ